MPIAPTTSRVGGLLSILFLCLSLSAQDASAPTVQICGGDQFVCLTASPLTLCVTVAIAPNFVGTIDSLSIDWGDGTDPEFFYDETTTFNRFYQYDFSEFYLTCQYELSGTFITLPSYIAEADNPYQNIFP